MKTAVAKTWRHVSKLGEAKFSRVPIMVDDDFPVERGSLVSVKEGDRRVAIGGDVIQIMEREVAKQWVRDFVDGGRRLDSLTASEIHGILLAIGINKTEFASLLRVDKGTVTKLVAGTLSPYAPVAQLMLIYLAAELSRPKPGTVKTLLEEGRALFWGLSVSVPAPSFVIKKSRAA